MDSTPTDYGPLCGNCLGCGSFRTVYAHRGDSGLVIKQAQAEHDKFHNWLEWSIYKRANAILREVLAPVHAISYDGEYLVMERADTRHDVYTLDPHQVQAYETLRQYFADIKYSNIGILNGRCVAVDYALMHHPMLEAPVYPMKCDDEISSQTCYQ